MLKETLRQYSVALVVSAILFTSFYFYLQFYYQTTAETLPKILILINRILANTSITLLGIVLLLGPFSRLYNVFDRFINYRKELGILALFTAATHTFLVMFPLARRGPFGFYQARPLVAYAGLTALLIMVLLFISSFESVKRALGTATWWKFQYRGVRIAFLAALFHFSVLRYQHWAALLNSNQPPSLNDLVVIFSLYVIAVRFTELLKPQVARLVPPLLAIILIFATSRLLF